MLDQIDFQILNILQENGRTKRNVLAENVGLSLPSLSERMKKLEERGLIEGYYAKLKKKGFGYDLAAFVTVVMDSSKNYPKLTENADKNPNILECHSVLGEGSHILKVIVKNTEALEKLLATIQSWPGVTRTITHFILSTSKETSKIFIE
ncbi:MAG: Lrp/AsnC family transcriptional regulator [Ignavibacteriales bacterium]|nr:Lrp/AsnC family transcriptional regulator [Ignavibacteriales bacterium]